MSEARHCPDSRQTSSLVVNRMVRYEDLSLDPVKKTRLIFDFLGFKFSQQVSEFLESHTKTERQDTDTVRDTKTAPFKVR